MAKLTDEQLSFFREEGYLVVRDVFPTASLEPLREELHEIMREEAKRLLDSGRIENAFLEEPFEHHLAMIYETDSDAAQEIIKGITGRGGGGHSGKALFEIIRHPNLLSIVESIIGEEIVGSSVYRIRPKVPGLPKGVVPWHQDSGYFQPHCDREMIVTVWFPLVDATAKNGCLRVIPRAHRREVYKHYANGPNGYLVIHDEDLPECVPETVPVPLGDVLLLTNRTPHSSTENRTDVVRWSVDLRYQSAAVPSNVGETPEEFQSDRPEHEIACYSPEADFVVQSRRYPENVVQSWEEFSEIRQRYEVTRPPGPQRWEPASE